jgi:hypothetical protein
MIISTYLPLARVKPAHIGLDYAAKGRYAVAAHHRTALDLTVDPLRARKARESGRTLPAADPIKLIMVALDGPGRLQSSNG